MKLSRFSSQALQPKNYWLLIFFSRTSTSFSPGFRAFGTTIELKMVKSNCRTDKSWLIKGLERTQMCEGGTSYFYKRWFISLYYYSLLECHVPKLVICSTCKNKSAWSECDVPSSYVYPRKRDNYREILYRERERERERRKMAGSDIFTWDEFEHARFQLR